MVELTLSDFADRIRERSPESLDDRCVRALHGHYRLLLRWNETISLVGPGTLANALEAHYGEALAAIPLLDGDMTGRTLVDIGSGAGFPGFVLAAARPDLQVVLVEARERKWAFLKNAVAETAIRCECLLGTIDRTLPARFPGRVDWLTLRAVKLPERAWRALASRLAEGGRVLIWAGRDDPALPRSLLRVRRTLSIPDSHSKRILELELA
jgi:16S rRNA (guanine527-N7)-methyltransferase